MLTATCARYYAALLLLIGSTLLLTYQADAQEHTEGLRLAAESTSPLSLKVEEAFGKTFLFDYILSEERHLTMHVTVQPHEISWIEWPDGEQWETNQAKSVQLDDHRLMMSWTEESGHFVVIYLDVLKGETTFCGLLRPGIDKEGACYTGTLAAIE